MSTAEKSVVRAALHSAGKRISVMALSSLVLLLPTQSIASAHASQQQAAVTIAPGTSVTIGDTTYTGAISANILHEADISPNSIPSAVVSEESVVTLNGYDSGLGAATRAAASEKCQYTTFRQGTKNSLGRWITLVSVVVYYCYNGTRITVTPTVSRTGYAAYGWVYTFMDGTYEGFCSSARTAFQAGGRGNFSFIIQGGLIQQTRTAYGRVFKDGATSNRTYC